jgi:hypothetical protein
VAYWLMSNTSTASTTARSQSASEENA